MTITNACALAAGLGIKSGPLHDKLQAKFHPNGERKMNNSRAIDIIEGVEPADEETQVEAWQHLIDTGLAWRLQGSIGRQADRMINGGLCHYPEQS